jgi:hypothetical protein
MHTGGVLTATGSRPEISLDLIVAHGGHKRPGAEVGAEADGPEALCLALRLTVLALRLTVPALS